MKKTLEIFFSQHFERLFFMLVATVFGGWFYYFGTQAKGETILIGVAMFALNKVRSPKPEKPE